MDSSLLEEVDDQSFDLSESGMMSFQDIKTELDVILAPQSPQHRHILQFPFRIPRSEKKENITIKEHVPFRPNADPSTMHNRKAQGSSVQVVDKDKVNDTYELSKQFEKSHFARVRARFVVPCILVRGKNICRSATLSNEVEVFMHSVNQKINDLNQKRKMFLYGTGERSPDKEDHESSLEKQRLEDVELLHQLGVTYINDLMVENRKVKYGLKVTSSEKVDSFGRYSKFKLVATPYPGVEFFQKFKANKYSARKLCFDWSQNFADAELQLPPGHVDYLGIRWRDYKSWDLIELTQNYLRLYLTHIADDSIDQNTSGTGWDRTPLFISLLRISLWADGEAHESLTAAEILYLTMGYDWFLFKCVLQLFDFCFTILQYKKAKEASRQSSQQATSRSPLLRDIGRVRDGVFATATSDSTDPNGPICGECRARRRPSINRESSSIRNTNDAASSTDGKPSSWQFISFSTPPGKDRNGSPRAPFIPTLQAMSKTSGSPLGVKRGSTPSEFIEDLKATSGDNGSPNPHISSGSSPFTLNDGRFRLGVQQINARRSSSSSIPGLFADESKWRQSQGVLSSELARVSTSPNLLSDQTRGESGGIIDETNSKDSTGDKPGTPRKRASTFDGGLLLSSGQGSQSDHEDVDSKSGEDDEEDDEDLTSGDDDNLHNEVNNPKEMESISCQLCHQPILFGSSRTQNHSISMGTMFDITQPSPSIHSENVVRPIQSMSIDAGHFSERARGVDGLHSDDYPGAYRDSRTNECDREENMFQLEIDERPTYRRCSEGSESDCLEPCTSSSGGYHGPICSNLYTELGQHTGNVSSVANDTGSIEGDENESFWDETSTVDYGYSPGSILNGFGLGLTKCQLKPGLNSNKNGSGNSDLEDIETGQCKIDSDLENDDDDDDDDGTASINSRRSSVKTDHHHENDHLFAPSLEGVFSNSSRLDRRSGQYNTSVPRSVYMTQDHGSDSSLPFQDGILGDGMSRDIKSDQNSGFTKPQTLTRRQKLKQLRRLFMDIRGEIGDGSRPPSRTLDLSKAKSSDTTGMDDDDDINSSLRPESFSDDSSFQYRSPTSTFTRHNTPVSPSSSSSRTSPNQMQSHRAQPIRSYGELPITSPTHIQHRSQHQHRNQVPSASGRKSPFEWPTSFGSTASGIISAGFGLSNSGSSAAAQSQHAIHPHQLGVQSVMGSAPIHHHQYHQHHILNNVQSPVSGTTTPTEGFQEIGSAPLYDHTGPESGRGHSLVSSTTSTTSKLRGSLGGTIGIRDKGGESSGRWDWMPGIFV
ncbi:Myotubularin- protein 14 [Linnemannia zychae]|nr:Myotubularin- protein 14 [Linnemannia zychae]